MSWRERENARRDEAILELFRSMDNLKAEIREEEDRRRKDITTDCDLSIDYYHEQIEDIRKQVRECPCS